MNNQANTCPKWEPRDSVGNDAPHDCLTCAHAVPKTSGGEVTLECSKEK